MKPRHQPQPDARLIRMIAARAVAAPTAVRLNRVDLRADLAAAHARCPLRLDALLRARDLDFFADVLGIHRNLDRATGALMNGFTPRFVARPHQQAA